MKQWGPSKRDLHELRLQALLSDDHDLYQLFQTSPEFRMTIESCARAMPELIAAIAETSRRATRDRELATELLTRHPPGWPFDPPKL